MIDRGPLEGDSNSAHEAGNRFCRRCAPLSMPTPDAESLAFSVGEAQARPSATGIWEMSVKALRGLPHAPKWGILPMQPERSGGSVMLNRFRALETTVQFIEQVRLESGVALDLTLATDIVDGPRMALVVLDPTFPGSRVQVRIEAGPDTLIDQLVDIAQGIEWVCVSLPDSVRNEVRAVLEAKRGGAIASVHILGASNMPEVPVPLVALGPNLDHEIPIINRALRSMVASMLQSPTDFKRSPLYAKIYICGAGKKNHGNPDPPIPDGGSGCPIVNVVICGKKKDKKEDEVMTFDSERNDSLKFLRNDGSVPANGIIAYIQFIMDGGMLDDIHANSIGEFNELARIARSVANSINETQ